MPRPRVRIHGVPLARREALLFEAGIKLGGVFHQYLGVPVSPRTAAGLARAIEAAVSLQPFVDAVHVRIDPSRGGRVGRGRFGYRYLSGEMLDVVVQLRDGPVEVRVRLAHRPDLRYPLMSVVALADGHHRRRRASSPSPNRARRPSRTSGRSGRRTGRSAE